MAASGGLTFCLDESMGRPLAGLLRNARAPGLPHILDMHELGLTNQGLEDEVVMPEVRYRGVDVLVAKDSRMLAASIRRDAWRTSGLTLFLLDGKWGVKRRSKLTPDRRPILTPLCSGLRAAMRGAMA